ncbi:hypothetical protein IE53DRAFT_386881 [Violaceomyces palustris]|uniref:Uncharacterized protein n=1 Tax=Violaceomyces palustris TaxID=1673888 RepID=A0ACD0NYJ1_9BASI|nr:hypothetical protein IE53DRAFT_386881 [Violaceomyces palustris]
MTVVLPGDIVPLPSSSSSSIKLGPGLLPSQPDPSAASSSSSSHTLTSIRPGALGQLVDGNRSKGKRKDDSDSQGGPSSSRPSSQAWWVETNTKRYIPSPGDSVIGQITNRGAESYTVSLFSAHQTTLPALSFEGATKRHKPNLKIGQLVYARVVSADRFTEPELTCVDPVTGKSEGFGELKVEERNGKQGFAMVWKISIGLARSLLRPNHKLLPTLANHFPFEAAIGANGQVWIRASEPRQVITVGKVLEEADSLYYPEQDSNVFRSGMEVEEEEQEQEGGLGELAEKVVLDRGMIGEKRIKALVANFA